MHTTSGRQDAVVMDLGARDAAHTYFELRDRGEEDQPAFEAALRAYCSHFPTTNYDATSPLVAQIIAEACSERGNALQRSARARKAAKARWAKTKRKAS